MAVCAARLATSQIDQILGKNFRTHRHTATLGREQAKEMIKDRGSQSGGSVSENDVRDRRRRSKAGKAG